MEKLNDILFYNIDKAIRTYRNYAQKRLREHGYKITIDQWLTIKAILENPGITQQDLAEKIFKDNASVTRIIEILVQSGYLHREVNPADRRKTILSVTDEGLSIIEKVQNLVLENRQVALTGIVASDIETANNVLLKIIKNSR
ncbi:MarR family winged helix-turn-helix transcriptional regulator [Flavobacterium caeni]|uniref:DNA-binding transcriptional regulator, MarR family n=1 Tax=Flavobacterium caeni TaxID=490189 RepID=A0A1G5JD83_9FLAO|nr:MarR family transcriptional regulator [Flavobacterium caeni]SCY86285.1 DNA-binding transcriptional regulator, MarR family [Flavobacterium caeni]